MPLEECGAEIESTCGERLKIRCVDGTNYVKIVQLNNWQFYA